MKVLTVALPTLGGVDRSLAEHSKETAPFGTTVEFSMKSVKNCVESWLLGVPADLLN